MSAADYIGAIGVGLLVLAYLLSTLKIVSQQNQFYLILNLVGAALACLAAALIDYWPFIILEGVWAIVSFIALLKVLWKKQKSTTTPSA